MSGSGRSWVWRLLPVAIIAGLTATALAFGAQRYLSLDALVDNRAALRELVAQNRLAALGVAALIYVLVVTLSLPGGIFLTIGSGAVFGAWIGGLLAVASATTGAILIFLIARSAFGQVLVKRAGKGLSSLIEGFNADAASYMLFLRLVPLFPFSLVNLAPAVAGVSLRTFAWTTFVGIIPGTFAFAFAGAGLDSILREQGAAGQACLDAGRGDCAKGLTLEALVTRELLLAFALLGIVALIPVVWRRVAGAPKAEAGKTAEGRAEAPMGDDRETITTDICVIGAGSGGLSVAAAAAAFGVPVVLIERAEMGGDCLNVGCVPSKALLAAGHAAQAMRAAALFGLVPAEPQVDFAAVAEHVAGVIRAIAPNDSTERFTALGVQVIKGEARFRDARSVTVGGQVVTARRFVIATGSRPSVPPIPGLDAVPYLTNETVFRLTRRPERLLILGGGAIGVELSQAFRRLGCAVEIVEGQQILSRDDPEASAVIRRALLAEGVVIHEGAKVVRVEQEKAGRAGARIRLVLDGDGGTLEGSHLLVATGRTPSLDALGLEAAGITFDKRGIVVDAGLRTTNRRVFAIGDCASGQSGGLQFTHVANYHAGLVIRSALFRLPVKVDVSAIPRVTYCAPELASVGLSQAEAEAKGQSIRILRWTFAENDRAQAEHSVEGLVKLVCDPRGRILGMTIAGPHAGELIVPWCMAVQKKMSVKDMAGLVFPYPTFSEATKRAAMSFYTPLAARPGIRRLISILRKLG